MALYLTLRLPKVQAKKSENALRLEYLSATLLLVSVAIPLFALNLGGEIFAWTHPLVVIFLCITPGLFALFFCAETYVAVTPIVPKRFILDRNVVVALACTLPMKFVFDQVSLAYQNNSH